ncbi:hypothetical protein ACFQHV_20795 [Promicromonospora thailandica]|uniref:Uncharacterized protein n=1 Tax=Promicromonospora thailandica TaxID=765201 RepID=A0A9X2GF97_9MICO|nr:hypothetical protein [Promicromonospora thailandica]MCP2267516.1 hypothetical protein [Promicromonospora thailandica]
MSGTVAPGPAGAVPDGQRPGPGPASVALRPLGYLLIGSVWLAIWLVAVLLLVGSVPYLAFADSDGLVEGVGDRLADPVEAVVFLLVLVPIAAAAVGAGGWYVLTASWPLAVLSFVYVVRALSPAYARQKLSFTARAAWGSTIGPPTVGNVALSLQPVRATRFTDRVMRFYVAGWSLNVRMLLAMLPAGLAWVTAIGALAPSVPEVLHVVFGALTVLLLGASWTLGVRAFRGDVSAAPHDGVGAMSADQRAQRLKELRKQREKRLRER